jgi:hypothetical protein
MKRCRGVTRVPRWLPLSAREDRAGLISALAALSLAVPALGQSGTGSLTIEASRDGGAIWERGVIDIGGRYDPLRIRIRAEWSSDVGMYAFAGAQFDIAIGNTGPGDMVTDPFRPVTMRGGAQTVVASRFGTTIKIDDSRDTFAPGGGARGVFPGQLVENFAEGVFTRDNPVTIFEFRFTPDASLNRRTFQMFYIAREQNLAMRVYTSPGGAQNIPVLTTNLIDIIDTPTPGAAALLALATVGIIKRRR